MKVLFDHCSQSRPYADSFGKCLVELEENETVEDVKEKFTKPDKQWHERMYTNVQELTEFEYGDKKYTGRLVLMHTRQAYTG